MLTPVSGYRFQVELSTFNLKLVYRSIKTRPLASMTRHPRWINQNEQRIFITIHADFHHGLDIP
jgi:hypothetical protein